MNTVDFIPHGLIAALSTVVAYVYNGHIKQDDARFAGIKGELETIATRLQEVSDKMSENHTAVLNQFISQGRHAATLASVAEALSGKIQS